MLNGRWEGVIYYTSSCDMVLYVNLYHFTETITDTPDLIKYVKLFVGRLKKAASVHVVESHMNTFNINIMCTCGLPDVPIICLVWTI